MFSGELLGFRVYTWVLVTMVGFRIVQGLGLAD